MNMISPLSGASLWHADIETGKVISEWRFQKDGVDVAMKDITTENKAAQVRSWGAATLLGAYATPSAVLPARPLAHAGALHTVLLGCACTSTDEDPLSIRSPTHPHEEHDTNVFLGLGTNLHLPLLNAGSPPHPHINTNRSTTPTCSWAWTPTAWRAGTCVTHTALCRSWPPLSSPTPAAKTTPVAPSSGGWVWVDGGAL